jgi:transcriptional regulator GlxA family with amidase domain
MNKKNVGIFIFKDAEVLDFAGPFEVFSVTTHEKGENLFNVFTVSKEQNPVRAINGLSVNPDYNFQDAPKIDILILAGGSGTRALLQDAEVLKWVEMQLQSTEICLSICSAARILAKLGLLENNLFCTHHAVYEDISLLSPLSIPQKEKRFTQTTDKIYTSGGISAGIDLSFFIIEKLFGKTTALNTAKYMEYSYYQ